MAAKDKSKRKNFQTTLNPLEEERLEKIIEKMGGVPTSEAIRRAILEYPITA